jgi:hypothetical protein
LFLAFIIIVSIYAVPQIAAGFSAASNGNDADVHIPEYIDLYTALNTFVDARLPGLAVPNIISITPFPNAPVVIPVNGQTTWVEFEVIGTLLNHLTPAHFNPFAAMPWVQITGAPTYGSFNSNNTRAVLRVPVTVGPNPNVLETRDTTLTVGNTINTITGTAIIQQASEQTVITEIRANPNPMNVSNPVLIAGEPDPLLIYDAVFTITGNHFIGINNTPQISVANFIPQLIQSGDWISMGILTHASLVIVNNTTATLTIQVTVGHNPGALRQATITVGNNISPAVSGSVTINQPGIQDPVPPHIPDGQPPDGGFIGPGIDDEPPDGRNGYDVIPPCACDWFDDISVDDWFHDAVTIVAEHGLFHGTGDKMFEPHLPMNRAMFAQVLANLTRAQTREFYLMPSVFLDSIQGDWFHGAVQWGYHVGHVSGVGGWMFAPYQAVTREQMAGFLNRYMQMNSIALPHIVDRVFTDYADISWWAYDDVKEKQRAGIIGGYPDGSFRPQAASTRAEVASVFAQFLRATGQSDR